MQASVTEHRDALGEIQLEVLVRELLDDAGSQGMGAAAGATSEIAELRDMARRLRVASLRVPLPEGRFAVRRALLATAEESRTYAGLGRAAWRRAGLWLSMAAVVAIAGAFALGAGVLDALFPHSSPRYAFRSVLNKARGVFFPGRPAVGQYALRYEFPALPLPLRGATVRTAEGRVGGLPARLTLMTGGGACANNQPCGTFTISLANLSAPASAQFGELRGTFACATNGCVLTMGNATGVFANVDASHMSLSGTGASEGQLGTEFASLGEWVMAVTTAAETLETRGMLPGGLTVSDLVRDAATNGKDIHHGGGSGGSEKDVPNNTNPGKNDGKINSDNRPSGPAGTDSTQSTLGGAGAGGGSGTHGSSNVDRGKSGQNNSSDPTLRSSATVDGGLSSHGKSINGTAAPGNSGSDIGLSTRSGNIAPNVLGVRIEGPRGANVHGGISSGSGGVIISDVKVSDQSFGGNGGGSFNGGANINGGASLGNGGGILDGGVSVGASTSVGTGTSGGGLSVGVGVNLGAGTPTGGLGVGVGVNLGAGTPTGGLGVGVSANVNTSGNSGGSSGSGSGSPSSGATSGGGTGTSSSTGGTSSSTGGTASSTGGTASSTGGTASSTGGTSSSTGGTSSSTGPSGSVGVSVGGVGVSVGSGGININVGGLSLGGTGGGGGKGGSGRDAGNGNR